MSEFHSHKKGQSQPTTSQIAQPMAAPVQLNLRDKIGSVDFLPCEDTNRQLLEICLELLDRVEALEASND